MAHERLQCKHGTIVKTCRCLEGARNIKIVDCPPHCSQKDITICGRAFCDRPNCIHTR